MLQVVGLAPLFYCYAPGSWAGSLALLLCSRWLGWLLSSIVMLQVVGLAPHFYGYDQVVEQAPQFYCYAPGSWAGSSVLLLCSR